MDEFADTSGQNEFPNVWLDSASQIGEPERRNQKEKDQKEPAEVVWASD